MKYFYRTIAFIKDMAEDICTSVSGYKLNQYTDSHITPFSIQYPRYKSMDEFIDCERLASIDHEIRRGIQEYIEYTETLVNHQDKFRSGCMKLKFFSRSKRSARNIELTKQIKDYDYMNLNQSALYQKTPHCRFFPSLMAFIEDLPFKETARILIIFDTGTDGSTPHRDHSAQEICHEFIWFRSNLDKQFFVFCPKTRQKKHIHSYSAWFDTVNQYHGETPINKLSFSIRVDGVFNDALNRKIPRPPFNQACTAAYWASIEAGQAESIDTKPD